MPTFSGSNKPLSSFFQWHLPTGGLFQPCWLLCMSTPSTFHPLPGSWRWDLADKNSELTAVKELIFKNTPPCLSRNNFSLFQPEGWWSWAVEVRVTLELEPQTSPRSQSHHLCKALLGRITAMEDSSNPMEQGEFSSPNPQKSRKSSSTWVFSYKSQSK